MSPLLPELLLDSWPVMEWLKGRDPAFSSFKTILNDAFAGKTKLSMSRMNYGEVIYSIRKDFPVNLREQAAVAFEQLPIHLYSIDDQLVDEAAALKGVHKISYADAFAIAMAFRLRVPVVTGDTEFLGLKALGLRVHWVGK